MIKKGAVRRVTDAQAARYVKYVAGDGYLLTDFDHACPPKLVPHDGELVQVSKMSSGGPNVVCTRLRTVIQKRGEWEQTIWRVGGLRVGKGKLGPPNTVFHTCAIPLMYTCKTGLLNWAVVAPGCKDVGDRNVGPVPQNKRPV